MVEVIPSINALTFKEIEERIKKVEPYVSWCHFDVTDGIFSTHLTWNNPEDLVQLHTSLNAEVHLMIKEPEKVIQQWFMPPIKRVIIHLEASNDIDAMHDQCKAADIELGLAIRPDTSWEALLPWKEKIHFFEILAVNPGPAGQRMTQESIDKIVHLRQACPLCILEIDGGINPETARAARRAGINFIVSAGYIFSQPDIEKAIKELSG